MGGASGPVDRGQPGSPNIRNCTPDDPQFGWLEIGDVINIPWTMSGTPTPSAPSPSTSTPAAPGATAPAPTGGKSRCSVVIAGGTKIGITKVFQLKIGRASCRERVEI